MSTLITTLGIAFVVVLIAIALLAIGWLLKGTSILRPGACGRDPTKKRDDKSCGTNTSCSLCEREPEKTEKKKSDEAKDPDDI